MTEGATDTMNHLRTLIERREYVVDADKVANAILTRLRAGDDVPAEQE